MARRAYKKSHPKASKAQLDAVETKVNSTEKVKLAGKLHHDVYTHVRDAIKKNGKSTANVSLYNSGYNGDKYQKRAAKKAMQAEANDYAKGITKSYAKDKLKASKKYSHSAYVEGLAAGRKVRDKERKVKAKRVAKQRKRAKKEKRQAKSDWKESFNEGVDMFFSGGEKISDLRAEATQSGHYAQISGFFSKAGAGFSIANGLLEEQDFEKQGESRNMAVTHAGLKTGVNILTGIAVDAAVVGLAASASVTVPVIVAVAIGIVAGNLVSAGFDAFWNMKVKKKKRGKK